MGESTETQVGVTEVGDKGTPLTEQCKLLMTVGEATGARGCVISYPTTSSLDLWTRGGVSIIIVSVDTRTVQYLVDARVSSHSLMAQYCQRENTL